MPRKRKTRTKYEDLPIGLSRGACTHCQGSGVILVRYKVTRGRFRVTPIACPLCHGAGMARPKEVA